MEVVYKIEKLVYENKEDIPYSLYEYKITNPQYLNDFSTPTEIIEVVGETIEHKLQRVMFREVGQDPKIFNLFGDVKENELVDLLNTQIQRANFYKELAEKGQVPFIDNLRHYAETVGRLMADPNRYDEYSVNTLLKRPSVAKEMQEDAKRKFERDQNRKLAKIDELYKEMCNVYSTL